MIDFCVEQADSAESLALIGEVLGAAGVNIEGLCMIKCDDRSVIHFVVKNEVVAKKALEKAEIKIIKTSEVFVLDKDKKKVTGKPGSFGGICRMFAEHGLKIKFGYPAENNQFIFGVDDVLKARKLLGYEANDIQTKYNLHT